MAIGRTVSKWVKYFIDGFDFSTYFAQSDGLTWAFDAPELHGAADAAKGYLPNEIIGKHFSTFYSEADRKSGLPEHIPLVRHISSRIQSQ